MIKFRIQRNDEGNDKDESADDMPEPKEGAED